MLFIRADAGVFKGLPVLLQQIIKTQIKDKTMIKVKVQELGFVPILKEGQIFIYS